jgi:hypothetical protein
MFIILIIFVGINIIFSSIYNYVIPDAMNLLFYSFVPLYILTTSKINFSYFSEQLYKVSLILTLILPLYHGLRTGGYINYYVFGFVCHLNLIGIGYGMLLSDKKNILSYLFFITNFVAGLVYGSRSVALANVVCIGLFVLMSKKERKIKYWTIVILGTVAILLVLHNIVELAEGMNSFLQSQGINSRNMTLLVTQLREGSMDSVSSGRDSIYPYIISFLQRNPVIPSGLGVARFLTNGVYYHSHNFILEIFLIFGLPLGVLFIIFLLMRAIKVIRIKNYGLNVIFLTFFISFVVRSLFGTHFISDNIFMASVGMMLIKKNGVE